MTSLTVRPGTCVYNIARVVSAFINLRTQLILTNTRPQRLLWSARLAKQ